MQRSAIRMKSLRVSDLPNIGVVMQGIWVLMGTPCEMTLGAKCLVVLK